ncbi:2-succinyl-5-enolpyruvyl-6-hydroxy-3-cyclohexene-1-carboxylate synthase [Leucobacter sp. Z1108]|uniref:2-succinyl-5-enolpyruvyl-6-hydroxy-3- cyclohexene-1-carboxylate synthase n=1 Tax=Leucobacter sp. Z1108 TaxID=3439066 RepID=UPI003F3F6E33
MYAAQKNVQLLVALLKAHGISHVVISPGSRNMAFVRSVELDPFFTCYSVVDERSAAYFAIGISLATGQPVAMSSTSAQATRNYIPGMTEAFYRKVPLVVITADFHESLIGQGTMQAIRQMSIPSDSAKVSVQLPVVEEQQDAWYCERLINEALIGLHFNGSGPVHINVPIAEHWEGSVTHLPQVKEIRHYNAHSEDMPQLNNAKILVLVGAHHPFSPLEQSSLERFVESYGAVVYTNHLSNYHGAGAANGSLIVRGIPSTDRKFYEPDLLITIGEQIGEYDIDGFLKRARPVHWRVNSDGSVVDTYQSLSAVFQMPESYFFDHYSSLTETSGIDSYRMLWEKANARRVVPTELPLSHAYIAGVLSPLIPSHSVMHFAILSALRNWSFFQLDRTISCYSNVAAFGIDGCLSTFIGHSSATDQLCVLVIGDLAFFYDMNSIGIRHVRGNARIVLVNNSGGGEFRTYSHSANRYFGDAANEHIAAAGHWGSARGWAESSGWSYLSARTKEEFHASISDFLGESDVPVLLEIFTTMQDDSDGVEIVHRANTHRSLEQRIAQFLPPDVKKAVKKALRR